MTDDSAARARIREDLDHTFLVEASAGTGKTTELVRRIVAVLARGADVSRIAAVTFTDKAAGELKLRLRSQLEIERRSAEGTKKNALEHSLARLEEARVSTIHTFAADLLRERPVEAGVDPGFLSESEARADALFEQALDEWFRRALERPAPGLSRALSRRTRGTKRDELLRAALTLRRMRHLPAPWDLRPWDRRAAIAATLAATTELAASSEQAADARDALYVDLAPARAFAAKVARGARDDDEIEARLVDLAAPSTFQKARKGRGSFGPSISREEVLSQLEAVKKILADFALAASADLAVHLRGELEEVLVRYAELKHRRGLLDFDDLLLRARELLRSAPDARRALQARLTHLFVDEFQDTDPVQASILLHLAAMDPSADDPLDAGIAPGKLFVVGDPKQSIYRFRNADLGMYDVVKSRVEKAGGTVLYLTTSFRSVPLLQRVVNAAFAPKMTGDTRAHAPSYAPLEAARTDSIGVWPLVLLPAPAPYGMKYLSRKAIDGSLPLAVAAFIDWLLKSGARVVDSTGALVPIEAKHICLLFKQLEAFGQSQAEPFGKALSARGIPHVLVGGRSFYDRDEILAVLAALEAVERPDDALHVVATLRGLFFGLTDDSIFEYKLRYGHLHPMAPPITALPESVAGVGEAMAILARLHRLRNRRTFAETLRELIDKTRAHVSLALLPNGEQALANIHHLLNLREDGALSFRGFLDALRERADKRVSGEAPILEEAGNGVRMMTVHRAKGLEFPVVVLADPTSRMGGTPDRHVDIERGLGAARLFQSAPWELVDNLDLETAREQAEGVRVAYVAATRARDMLVVPIVGDDVTFPEDGWLSPIHAALAPLLRGSPEQPTGLDAPRFGDDTLLMRPNGEGPSRKTVVPGLHRTSLGPVVVWDPATLDLDRPDPPRVRRADIIAPSASSTNANRDAYLAFLKASEAGRAAQSTPSVRVMTATHAAHGDSALPDSLFARPVDRIVIPRSPARPGGPRFGDLVHQTLATIELSAGADAIAKVVRAIARLIGATDAEIAAAEGTVVAVTKHAVWSHFLGAEERGELRREVPLACMLDGGILEGVVDVAYLEDGVWTVIDFKTDRPEEGDTTLTGYERQVLLYALAIERATGLIAKGALLFV